MRLFPKRLSRRAVLGIAAAGISFAPSLAQTTRKRRALALIGDRYHNPDYIRVSLDRIFQDLDIAIDYTMEYSALSAALLKPYQLLLILRDGMIWPGGYLGPDAYNYEANLQDPFPAPKPVTWIREEQGVAVKDFVTAGGGFYALHNASHISLSSKAYREVMGGAYFGHPPLRPFQVHATANAHPITAGLKPFVVNDEQHYVDYDKDPRFVILESENLDGLTYEGRGTKAPAGWAYDHGKGRVVFTAVGHTNHALWNPQHVELQKRAVRWLLKDL
jgi:type 1 glutamine amidotransferase